MNLQIAQILSRELHIELRLSSGWNVTDPLGLGWDLFGTADRRIDFWMSPTAIWYIQLAAILGGHLLGVVLAHDRALEEFPKETAVRTQYAMLALMVVLTGVGLALLASS